MKWVKGGGQGEYDTYLGLGEGRGKTQGDRPGTFCRSTLFTFVRVQDLSRL